jgi:hypothetical protein
MRKALKIQIQQKTKDMMQVKRFQGLSVTLLLTHKVYRMQFILPLQMLLIVMERK